MKPCLVVYMIQLRFTTWDSDALSRIRMIYICSSTMSSVMNSVCCALVCLLCVSLVAWTITVTSGAPEEEGNGEGDNKQRLRGTEISRGVVCAINSSLDIQQVEENEDEIQELFESFYQVSLALEKGNQDLDSQQRHQHVQTMHHFTAGKIRW